MPSARSSYGSGEVSPRWGSEENVGIRFIPRVNHPGLRWNTPTAFAHCRRPLQAKGLEVLSDLKALGAFALRVFRSI